MKKVNAVKLVEQMIRRRMVEALRPTHQIEYYATVGPHGGNQKFYDFESAVRSAKVKMNDSEFMDGLEYVGVSPLGMETQFAIIYCTDVYLKRITPRWFDESDHYTTFKNACSKFISTGKIQFGRFK